MYQKITIVGNLGRDDPELKYTSTGSAVATFSVATNRTYTNREGKRVQETTWFRVSAWGRDAENCKKYLLAGDRVLVDGRLVSDPKTGGPRVYNRRDGSVGASFEISATEIRFLRSKDESSLGTDLEEMGLEGADSVSSMSL